MNVLVVGLGYVGLPVVLACIENKIKVQGVDTNFNVVEDLNGGKSHVDGITNNQIQSALKKDFQAFTPDMYSGEFDIAVICVPTPLDDSGLPDLFAIKSAGQFLKKIMRPKNLIVLESTSYPGTTEEVLAPILESIGLKNDEDYFLAFSPERIDPGNESYNFRNTPKIVSASSEKALQLATDFYSKITDFVVPSKGIREAETAKLLENTYRHVNIALVNEMAKFCHDLKIDIWEVIRLASTKPFGFTKFTPSAGVGGHCIPIDPNFLSFRVRSELGYPFRLVELAEEINRGMPRYVVARATNILNTYKKSVNGSNILIMGVTYKADISDTRESPSAEIARIFLELGAKISYCDSYVNNWSIANKLIPRIRLDEIKLSDTEFDLIILVQAHSEFITTDLDNEIVFDTTGKLIGKSINSL
jgi:UDP-N-acetyl-D-glucosamine dehydrogenase